MCRIAASTMVIPRVGTVPVLGFWFGDFGSCLEFRRRCSIIVSFLWWVLLACIRFAVVWVLAYWICAPMIPRIRRISWFGLFDSSLDCIDVGVGVGVGGGGCAVIRVLG